MKLDEGSGCLPDSSDRLSAGTCHMDRSTSLNFRLDADHSYVSRLFLLARDPKVLLALHSVESLNSTRGKIVIDCNEASFTSQWIAVS